MGTYSRDLPDIEPVRNPETSSYIKVTTLISEGFTWSLVTLVLSLVLGSLTWLVVVSPLAIALGLVIVSDKRDFPEG